MGFVTRGSQVQILPPRPIMKKAKIYKPSKTAMQSGLKKYDKWIIEFITKKPGINPLMGWESSSDTYSELNLEFKTKELAIAYAKKNKIDYELIEPKTRKINRKSYADNFKN
jgi:NADH dehydrogenase (ubiquinone) Fe-S protein 4